MCFSIYLTVYCLQFSEIFQIRYLNNKLCIHVQKYWNGAYSSQYDSHRHWFVVCVLLVCPHMFFQVCATNFFYTSYVIEMKPDEFTTRLDQCCV